VQSNQPHWGEEHINPHDDDMFVNIGAASDLTEAHWCIFDDKGGSVVINLNALSWLETLLPQIRLSYLRSRAGTDHQSKPTTEA
jgi:hypothetical protein